MLLLLTLTHCLGGNRSHSTQEDVYFVDEVLVDFADRGQTCLAGANSPAAGHSVFDQHQNSADSPLADSKDHSIERNNLLGNLVPL